VLSGPVPDELSTTLTADCVCDEPISRRAIEVWSLVAQMLEQFQGPAPDFKTCGGGPRTGRRRTDIELATAPKERSGEGEGRCYSKIKYCSNWSATG